jgi:hypothetical protein
VAQQAFAKLINDIRAHAEMCGMEDRHGGHSLTNPYAWSSDLRLCSAR